MAQVYQEQYRPQFHFSAQTNWINDPNGCVFYKGEYHLFFQHNPESVDWGNMTWGHAISKDMVHWEQLPHAIYPDELGTIFSGSATVDYDNTTGFKTGDESPIIACFTYAGKHATEKPEKPFTQAIAYSNDRGRTFTKYEGNPILPNITGGTDRDPKIFWYEPGGYWVMVLYLDATRTLGFFSSSDLKNWTQESECGDFFECPDLFELAVDGDESNTRWVVHGASGEYFIGDFNGKVFAPHHDELIPLDFGSNFYAAQSFNNSPDGRRVQIGWMRGGKYPDMPFNQQMSFPCELTLRKTSDGVRLFRWPIAEIERLYVDQTEVTNHKLSSGEEVKIGESGALFDIQMEVEASSNANFVIKLHDEEIGFGNGLVRCLKKEAPLQPVDNKLNIRILVDRASVEVFGNEGQVCMSSCFLPEEENTIVTCQVKSGSVGVQKSIVHQLAPIWK